MRQPLHDSDLLFQLNMLRKVSEWNYFSAKYFPVAVSVDPMALSSLYIRLLNSVEFLEAYFRNWEFSQDLEPLM